jgi:hypothetical protein
MPNRIRDIATRLTVAELDEMKHRASVAMRRVADLATSRARTVIESGYSAAHLGLLRAQTEDEIDRIERDWAQAVRQLKGMLEAFDDA